MTHCFSPGKKMSKWYIFYLVIFLFTFSNECFAAEHNKVKIAVQLNDKITKVDWFDLKKGENMFYGVIPLSKEAPACVSCHTTTYIDTLNWNPSAYEIAIKYANRNASELLKVVNNPIGKKMPVVHAGYAISDDQVILLQGYLTKLSQKGEPVKKQGIVHRFLFILLNIIALLVTIDLFFTKKIPYRAVHLIILLATATYITKEVVVEGIGIGRQKNYQPAQPIKFSHKVHAGQNQIDCQYCHNTAERSKSAGIPPVNICMNCHSLVVEGTRSGKFEINKVRTAFENKTPIEWVKIHNLPDHVFFSHAQHVAVGKVNCNECHGELATMDVVHQVKDLSMGFCLNCHRTRKVDFEDNKYYALFQVYHDKIKKGEMDSVLVKDIGGTNCMKCHY